MGLFSRKKSQETPPPPPIAETELVEDIVARIKAAPPAGPVCFVDLEPGGTLPGTHWSRQGWDVLCFTQRTLAEEMVRYGGGSVLAIGTMAELWALLFNPVRGVMIKPVGLRIDYGFDVAGYVRYSPEDLRRLGWEGFSKGFKRSGELAGGRGTTIHLPPCLICRKPVHAGIDFHCLSCGFRAELHESCLPCANLFGRSVMTIGGGGVSCPRCGARG